MESKHSGNIEEQLQGNEKELAFYNFHGVQLYGMKFPGDVSVIRQLHDKLERSVFDGGDYFELIVNEETESFEVIAKQDLKAGQDSFLIDHAFSFRYPELRKALNENSHLKERVSSMLTFADTKRTHPEYPKKTQQNEKIPIFEYDNQEIEDPSTVNVPETAIGLSFWGNNISEIEKLKLVLDKLPNLKVLWLNENPIAADFENLMKWIEENYKHIQIVNSQFTVNVDLWGVKFANMYPNLEGFDEVNVENIKHLDLSSRNIFHLKDYSLFSEFKKLKSVNLKSHEMASFLDTNRLFDFVKHIPQLKNIDCEGQIYDVLWDLHTTKKLHDVCPTLGSINDYDLLEGKPKEEEDDIRSILKNIWKINGTYRVATSEQMDETNVWYILDEFGSGIQRGLDANASIKPFLYAPNNKLDENVISYSLLWLTKDVKQGDKIVQDYLEEATPENALAKTKVWFDIPNDTFLQAFKKREAILDERTKKAKETKLEQKPKTENKDQVKLPMRVATDYELVVNKLTSENYKIVKGFEEADILWLITKVDDNAEFLKGKYINQFPNEVNICMKHNLAKTVNEGAGKVKWLQETYDLTTELNEFVGCFLHREKNHYDNHWIIKAPNLARSLDMVITNNLDAILRLTETGPRLAQKYIHKPLTFNNKKIDHRFIVCVKSIDPLEVYIYKTFMTRTANHRFTLDPRQIDDYETHFTIMTYSGRRQDEIGPEWFLEEFDKQNKANNMTWNDVYGRIKDMVREIFTSIAKARPEMHKDTSRAIYGMDVMIDANYQPKLIELTFAPDCKRPSTLSPSFWNDILDCFFLGEVRNMDRVI